MKVLLFRASKGDVLEHVVLSGILVDYKFPTRIKRPPSFEAVEAAPPTVLSPDGAQASSLSRSFAALSPHPVCADYPVFRFTTVPGGAFKLKQIIEVQHRSKSDPVTNGIGHMSLEERQEAVLLQATHVDAG